MHRNGGVLRFVAQSAEWYVSPGGHGLGDSNRLAVRMSVCLQVQVSVRMSVRMPRTDTKETLSAVAPRPGRGARPPETGSQRLANGWPAGGRMRAGGSLSWPGVSSAGDLAGGGGGGMGALTLSA